MIKNSTQQKNIVELLELLLQNQNRFESGLCNWVNSLYFVDIITNDEFRELKTFIKKNRPSKFSSCSAFIKRNSEWYWKENKIKPRIKWIKKHITKLKSEQNVKVGKVK